MVAGDGGRSQWTDHLLQSATAMWAALAGCVLWLVVLTVVVAVRCRVDGEPVFKRLPNGRVRFTWGIPQLLGYAQRCTEQHQRTYRHHVVTVSELQAREQSLRDQRADEDRVTDR